MKRRDERETQPTSNLEGRPKILTCKVPGQRAKATMEPFFFLQCRAHHYSSDGHEVVSMTDKA